MIVQYSCSICLQKTRVKFFLHRPWADWGPPRWSRSRASTAAVVHGAWTSQPRATSHRDTSLSLYLSRAVEIWSYKYSQESATERMLVVQECHAAS